MKRSRLFLSPSLSLESVPTQWTLTLLALWLLFFLVLQPSLLLLGETQEKIRQTQEAQNRLEKKISELNRAQDRLRQEGRYLENALRLLPEKTDLLPFTVQLEKLIEENNLVLLTFSALPTNFSPFPLPASEILEELPLVKQIALKRLSRLRGTPFHLSVRGEYSALLIFFQKLEGGIPFVRLKSVTVKEEQPSLITVDLEADLLSLPEKETSYE